MKQFIKQIMLVGSGENSVQTELAKGIEFSFDMDEIVGKMSFSLPYIKFSEDESTVDITRLKKQDTVKLFYGTFDENPGEIKIETVEPQFDENGEQIPVNGMYLVFDGAVDNIKLSKTKGDYPYNFECLGSLGIANYRHLERGVYELNSPEEMLKTLLQLAGLQKGEIASVNTIEAIDIFPIGKIRIIDTDADTLFIKVSGGKKLMEELQYVRKNYGLIIHQSGDGYINIMTPTQLLSSPDGINTVAWEFRLGENIFEIDYGDITSDINSVICVGRPPVVGYAVDPVAVQLNAGSGVTPGPQNYNYISIDRRDLASEEDCETVAKNTLLEILRNYTVQIKTLFDPRFMVGQAITVYDGDRYPDGKIFFIKSYTVTIAKDDVSCTIVGYSNSLTVLPENIVIESTGIADVDVLEVQREVEDATGWNSQTGGFT